MSCLEHSSCAVSQKWQSLNLPTGKSFHNVSYEGGKRNRAAFLRSIQSWNTGVLPHWEQPPTYRKQKRGKEGEKHACIQCVRPQGSWAHVLVGSPTCLNVEALKQEVLTWSADQKSFRRMNAASHARFSHSPFNSPELPLNVLKSKWHWGSLLHHWPPMLSQNFRANHVLFCGRLLAWLPATAFDKS